MRRPTLDRILLIGILVLQVVILGCLFWQPLKRGPSLSQADRPPDLAPGEEETPDLANRVAAIDAAGNARPTQAVEESLSPISVSSEAVLRHVREMRAKWDAARRETMREFARLDDIFGVSNQQDPLFPFPSIDMQENPQAYVIVSTLPGIDSRHIRVVLTGRTLTLTALQYPDRGPEGWARHFERTFRFPGPVVNDPSAEAWVSNGVLRVCVPKADRWAPSETKALRLL